MTMQGVLQAAGDAARAIETVSWVLFAGGFAIFAGVMLLLVAALRHGGGAVRPMLWILGGGVLFPGTVLAALFAWTVQVGIAWKPAPPPGALVVMVTAHMWWWDVRYRDPATGAEVRTANELRIPAGRPVYLALASADVIHSFWVPQLAGKMDMVPGRQQHLLVSVPRPGRWRGQCAEFCGEQHARMALHVEALEPAAFDAWLKAELQPAAAATSARQELGRQAFLANRCEACHTVRGVGGASLLGPELTHVGNRGSIGAGTLDNTAAGRERWIAHVQEVKKGARMPSYERLDPETLGAMAEWLGALR